MKIEFTNKEKRILFGAAGVFALIVLAFFCIGFSIYLYIEWSVSPLLGFVNAVLFYTIAIPTWKYYTEVLPPKQ